MALTLVNVGTTANDGTGDSLRTAFQTVNAALSAVNAAITFSAANVAVGGAFTPSARLHVRDSGSATVRVETQGSGYSDLTDVGGDFYISADRGGNGGKSIIFRNNGTTEIARFTAAKNFCFGLTAAGTSSVNVIAIANGTAPTANVAGGQLYVEAGALKYRGSGGTITTLGNA